MLIPILILSVLAIILIFFLVKASAVWNWVPITMVLLIFITSIFGGIAASQSLKIRRAWKAQYLSNERDLEREKLAYDEALIGPADTVFGYGQESLRHAALQLRLSEIGKGRVWPAGFPSRNGDQFTVTFTPEGDADSPASQIEQDLRLFAFEASDRVTAPGGGEPPAADFIGSFKVVAVDTGSNSVTLEPLFLTSFFNTGSLMRQLSAELGKADRNIDKIRRIYIELQIDLGTDMMNQFDALWKQANLLSNTPGDAGPILNWLDSNSSNFESENAWTLFEKMPGDDRTAFLRHAGLEPFGDDNPATIEKLTAWREQLETVYMPAEELGLDPNSAVYEELIDQYNFDGAKVNEIEQYLQANRGNRISDQFEKLSNDEMLFSRVLFEKPSENFVVDGSAPPGLGNDFGPNGAANNPDLKLGRDVQLTGEVDLPKINTGTGVRIDEQQRAPSILDRNPDSRDLEILTFKRPLRDYLLQLGELRQETRRAITRRGEIESDLVVNDQMVANTTSQERVRSRLIDDLRSDIAAQQQAKNEIERLNNLREAERTRLISSIQTTYNQIIELRRALETTPEFLDTRAQPSNKSEQIVR